jgi:CRISPR-associated protein Cas2
MPHLICYDITADGLRAKLSKKINESGLDRINKSVYLGTIGDSSLNMLELGLAKLVQEQGGGDDSLIVLPVTIHQVEEMRIYGRIDPERDELTGEKSTLIL